MNVIVSNKYQSMLETLDLEIIKSVNGQFEVEEIIDMFKNFFYQRMILDITAIKDYKNIKNMQKLSISLDMDKLILVLDDSQDPSEENFLSQLISMGIYNFTKNKDGIDYLYHHPNSYRDVAQYQQLGTAVVQIGPAAINQQTGMATTGVIGPKIIGFKNITKQTGATTLIYMLKRQLEENYETMAVEIDRHEFAYFNSKNMESTPANDFANFLAKHGNKEVILVDINGVASVEALCNEVIYLIEPSTIKLNKLMATNRALLLNLKDKKVILNQSLLTHKDVLDFEYEAKMKIFFNMPPLDEHEKNINILNIFLTKLGFTRQSDSEEDIKKKKGLFGF